MALNCIPNLKKETCLLKHPVCVTYFLYHKNITNIYNSNVDDHDSLTFPKANSSKCSVTQKLGTYTFEV